MVMAMVVTTTLTTTMTRAAWKQRNNSERDIKGDDYDNNNDYTG